MKKRVLLFLTTIGLCCSMMQAQSSFKVYYNGAIASDTILVDIHPDSLDVMGVKSNHINFKNETTQNLVAKCYKIVVSAPSEVETTFCGPGGDLGICYIDPVTNPFTVNAGVEADFKVTCAPGGTKTPIQMRYTIKNEANQNDSATVLFYYSIGGKVGIIGHAPVKQEVTMDAYPNPVVGNGLNIRYTISKIQPNTEIIIRNMLGVAVKQIPLRDVQGKVSLFAEDFSNGVYFYSLVSNGQVLSTKKLIIKR